TFYNSNTPHGSPRNRALARGIHGIISYSETSVSSSENTLTYKNTFSKSHNLEVMGGLSFQEMKTITHGFGTMGIPDESLIMQGLELGLPYTSYGSGGQNAMLSAFTRLNYDYKSKYLLTTTFRADGSSKFAKGNRFGYFPSVAFAWNMKKEEFLR